MSCKSRVCCLNGCGVITVAGDSHWISREELYNCSAGGSVRSWPSIHLNISSTKDLIISLYEKFPSIVITQSIHCQKVYSLCRRAKYTWNEIFAVKTEQTVTTVWQTGCFCLWEELVISVGHSPQFDGCLTDNLGWNISEYEFSWSNRCQKCIAPRSCPTKRFVRAIGMIGICNSLILMSTRLHHALVKSQDIEG